jgi:trans-2,3-dihydro-3-hydroxyanthranilate isomerase
MRLDIAWWDLDRDPGVVAALREDLRSGSAEPWRNVPRLRWKLWMADRERDRWGAVMLWDPDRPSASVLPPNRAAELIGRPPAVRAAFAIEAVAEAGVPSPTLRPGG